MANDDETLTFRLRAVAENMAAFGKAARGAEDVNAAMVKSKKVAEDLAAANKKLTAARDKESNASARVRAAETNLSAARDKASTAAGRVRVAETNLNEVRGNTKAKMTQIAAAEERLAAARRNAKAVNAQIATAEDRLATARRNSARATGDANKVEEDFRKVATGALAKIAQDSGESSGHRFSLGFRKTVNDGSIESDATRKSSLLSRIFGGGGESSGHGFIAGFKKFFDRGDSLSKAVEQDLASVGGKAEKSASLVGRTFGTGILSGLEGILRSEAGPAVLAALIAVVAVVAPAIGAVLAGGVVLGFGAGLAALAIVFATKSDAVKAKWKATTKAMSADLQGIAQPFDAVMIHLADSARATLGRFAPLLKSIFANSAGPVQKFADDFLGALERLKPALTPISNAFNTLLASLGPALQDMLTSLADGLTRVSNSVSNNPNGLPDFIRGIGTLTKELLDIIAILNDANGAFERMTGGTSAVTVTIDLLAAAVGTLLGPIIILADYLRVVGGVVNALTHSTKANGQSMSDAANHTVKLAQALKQTGGAASDATAAHAAHTAALAHANTATHAANVEAYNLAHAFEREAAATQHSIDLLNRRSDLLLALSGSEIDYAQSVRDANKAISENGHTHNLATQAGINNMRALNQVAAAAKNQRDNMLKANDGNVAAARSATASRATFVKLAMQMGFSAKEAQKMARDLIKIPNVTREAKLKANKKDLDQKLADVRRQLADKNLTKARIAQLQANKKDLEKKVRDAQAQLDGLHPKRIPPMLTVNPLLLQRKVAAAQAQIDHMHGKVVPITYTMNGTNFTLNTKTPSRVGGLAGGGPVSGPGSGTSDRAGIFALSNKEWVIKAKSSQKYGDYAMKSLNDGTATVIPGMARGGRAGSPINIHGTGVFASQAQLRKILGQQFSPITSTPSGGAGAGVQRWRGVALAALAAAHEPASWIGSLLARMQRESGGNPRAINLTDINAKRGDPSRGLMQTIASTFNAYAGPYRSRGIYDPFANIYAAIKYTVARYGSGPAGWNKAGGYKNGGWLMPGQTAYNETRRPEAVFNHKQLGEMGGGGPLVLQFVSDGSPYMEFLVREFRKYVRMNGGNVQKVLGPRA